MAHFHLAVNEQQPPGEREAVAQAVSGHQLRRESGYRLSSRCKVIEVSVCIANWNCRPQLRACLASLLQKFQGVSLEVIVVDNGSQDGAPEMVAAEFADVILVRNQANRGFARANNQAAQLAVGQYLFFLNNDTVVPTGTLERLLRFARSHPEVAMIGPALRDPQGRVQTSFRRRPTVSTFLLRTTLLRWTPLLRDFYRRYRRHRERDRSGTRHVEVLLGAALFMSRDVFVGCGGWDEEFIFGGEDLDLCTRVGRQHSIVYLPSVEIVHHGRLSTRQHIAFASRNIPIGFVRYLRKTGSSRLAILAYKTMMTLEAPIQALSKTIQAGWRLLCGRKQDAAKSMLACRGQLLFLCKGLLAFWRA
ncbi:MAG: glycosyltransferase family 2 protein [Gemmataceae bacterium]